MHVPQRVCGGSSDPPKARPQRRGSFKHLLEPERRLVYATFSHQTSKNLTVLYPILFFLPDPSLLWSDTAEGEVKRLQDVSHAFSLSAVDPEEQGEEMKL